MSHIVWDPDEWESVSTHTSYGTIAGVPQGASSVGWRRRSPEEIAKIRADRQRAEDDAVLARADAIRARRSADNT